MNIFFLHQDPVVAAAMLCDQHVTKMIVESMQMLSTVHHLFAEAPVHGLYKTTHGTHPCVLWLLESADNYRWLWQHALAIGHVHPSRYGQHRPQWAQEQRLLSRLRHPPPALESCGLTLPVAAMRERRDGVPPEYMDRWVGGARSVDQVVAAYRACYVQVKSEFARWSSQPPAWYLDGLRTHRLMHRLRHRTSGKPWPKGMTAVDSTIVYRAHPSLEPFRLDMSKDEPHERGDTVRKGFRRSAG